MRQRAIGPPLIRITCLLLWLVFPACATRPDPGVSPPLGPTSSPTDAPTPVPSVGAVEPVVSDLGPKDLRLKNCETETELVRTLSQQTPVEVETELTDRALSGDGGEARDISAELRLTLENLVACTYQSAYTAALDQLMQAEIRVPPNAEAIVRVRYWQESYEGTVSFSMEGRSFTSPYAYRLTYAKLEGFRRTACSA